MSIIVTIHRRTLLRKTRARRRACERGLALFDAIAALQGNPDRVRVRWSPLAQVWLAKEYPAFAWCLREHSLAPTINLDRVILCGTNLRRADLGRADLGRADLTGANLAFAYLGEANLGRADLEGADLEGADLTGANLAFAYLGEANLRGANLSGADLKGAYLAHANMEGAYRPHGTVPDGWRRVAGGYLTREGAT